MSQWMTVLPCPGSVPLDDVRFVAQLYTNEHYYSAVGHAGRYPAGAVHPGEHDRLWPRWDGHPLRTDRKASHELTEKAGRPAGSSMTGR
jgi:hypothetical protein